MLGGYMLNGDYVAPALTFIAALFGVLILGFVAAKLACPGTRRQLLLAWLLTLILLPPWLLVLTAGDDIFGVVTIARYALALPALAALWGLRRSIRAFKARHPALPPLPRKPWLLVALALALFGLLDYLSRHRYDAPIALNDTIASMVFIGAAALLLAGCVWALRSSIRWLRLAGPGSATAGPRR
ncbi:hypothetical protein [Achromobacter sp. NCFB-sbj8-Ac1-l]|uniref:hypothetical protein n=1 Tax=unclassified Achromobacter TaxID=2626865 RepID=UPI004046A56A